MKKLIYSIAVLGLSLSACSKSGESSYEPTLEGEAVTIATRTTDGDDGDDDDEDGYEGDNLSLSIIYDDTEGENPYNTLDSKWTQDADGVWSTTETVLWKNDTEAVGIFAFAPWVNVSYDETITFSVQADQSGGTVTSDFVTYQKLGFVPNATNMPNGNIPIEFAHRLSQLNIKLSYGDEFDEDYGVGVDPTVVAVKLNAQGSIAYQFEVGDDTTDTVTATGNKDAITMENSGTNIYTVICPPQTFTADDLMVTITLTDKAGTTNKDYEFFVPEGGYTLAKGEAYSLSIRVGKDRVVLDNDITVIEWGEVNELGGGDAELDRD